MSEIDFSDTIIAKSDQLNASDIAGSLTIKITDAKKVSDDQPIHIFYEGCNKKPWKPCKGMRRVMAQAWGSKVNVKGRRVTLVCDPTVTWAGAEVGGIRITHLSHIDGEKTFPLRISKHKVEKYKVLPLREEKTPVEPDPELVKAGDEASSKGVSAYTAWLNSLKPEQKEPLRKYHQQWTEKAKEAENEETISWE